ncbi:MAG: protein kinase [Polyangiaceae bacterium]|nr:protein kinase [Polyangiaceae bacterium]
MEEVHLRPGDIVAGKYRVEKVLGAGGMGVVVSARHTALNNLVAVKIMQPRAVAVKGAVERFLREGQAAAQLHSKHVTKVHDVGQLDSGAPYMIMEHLQGRDLADLVEKKAPFPSPTRVSTFCKRATRSVKPTPKASFTAISSLPTSSCKPSPTARR